MAEQEVRKRCVFFLGGYEPIPPERQHERFIRELRRFEQTWNTTAKVSPHDQIGRRRRHLAGRDAGPQLVGRNRIPVAALGRFCDRGFRPLATGCGSRAAIAAFADFILTGTAFRYFYFNWRYGMFFVYPILILASFVTAAIYAASLLVAAGLPLPYLLAPLIAFAVFAGLIVWPGRFLLLPYMLDDWLFAYEFIHRSRDGLEARLDSSRKGRGDAPAPGRFRRDRFWRHIRSAARSSST